ncbi:MAG: hypothetical protein N2258_00545, partial [Brevinematales bacterium]|nr:hypothetical protein [Brevinematales bacterium]
IILLIFLVKESIKVLETTLTPEPPSGFKQYKIITKKDQEKMEFYLSIDKPLIYQFFIAPNFNGEKKVTLKGEKRFIGLFTNELTLLEGDYGSAQIALVMLPGNYIFNIDFDIKGASIYFYTNIHEIDEKYLKRILEIDSGKIYNPPPGYKEIFKTNLNNLKINNLTIAKFEIKESKDYGFSAYSTKSSGKFSLRLVGGGYKGVELLNETRLFSDQLSLYLPKGSYEILLSSYDSKAQLVLYMTNY